MDEIEQRIADVIIKTNHVESRISDILSCVIKPVTNDYAFLLATMLHNTYLSLGQKLRLLTRIAEYWHWKDIEFRCFHDLLELRNGFAHTPSNLNQIVVWTDPETKKPVVVANEQVIQRKFKTYWKEQERGEAYSEFIAAYDKCLQTILVIGQRITERTPEAKTITIGQAEISG